MAGRYNVSIETDDGSVRPLDVSYPSKRVALRVAREVARTNTAPDVIRIWVDDAKEGIGIASFRVPALAQPQMMAA